MLSQREDFVAITGRLVLYAPSPLTPRSPARLALFARYCRQFSTTLIHDVRYSLVATVTDPTLTDRTVRPTLRHHRRRRGSETTITIMVLIDRCGSDMPRERATSRPRPHTDAELLSVLQQCAAVYTARLQQLQLWDGKRCTLQSRDYRLEASCEPIDRHR